MERAISSRHKKAKSRTFNPGTRTDMTGQPVRNLILLSVPDSEYSLVRPHLERLSFPQYAILREPGGVMDFGYFPNEGLASVLVLTRDGRSVEVGIVGKEGMIGTPLAFGLRRDPYRIIIQIPSTCLRISADMVEQILPDTPEMRRLLSRYVLIHGIQVAQIAACNRLHEIEQRLARWLLMCQDRVDSNLLPVTHEFLAQMLGTGRPSVSLAAGVLQRAGLIENLRGTVKILNRKELEESACECYRVIQNFNGWLGIR